MGWPQPPHCLTSITARLCAPSHNLLGRFPLHRRRRTALLLSAAIVAAPLLAACGNDAHPGAAAVVGDQRITVAQLESRVNEVRTAQRAAVTDDAQYAQAVAQTGSLARDTLHGMVLDKVLHRAAEDAGITVSRREVQEMRAGPGAAGGRCEGPGDGVAPAVRHSAAASRREPPPSAGGPETRHRTRHEHQPARLLERAVQGVQGTRRGSQSALRELGRAEGRPRRREDALGTGDLGGRDTADDVTM